MPKKRRQRRKPRPPAGPPRLNAPARSPGRAPAPELSEPADWYDDDEPYELYDAVQPGRTHTFDLARRLIGGNGQRSRLEDQIARLVNTARKKAGLSPLEPDERLRQSARAHGADMEARDYFAHVSPDGGTPSQRMMTVGYPYPGAENIARGQQQPNSVMHAWMHSPGHRRNILHPDFRTIGVGVHMGEYGPWWTQHFGY